MCHLDAQKSHPKTYKCLRFLYHFHYQTILVFRFLLSLLIEQLDKIIDELTAALEEEKFNHKENIKKVSEPYGVI